MLNDIDHIAIAVRNLEQAIAYYSQVFNAGVVHRETIETDRVEEALIRVGTSYIQLLSPTDEDSTVARFLDKRGEGLHHVGYRVSDCSQALEKVKREGFEVLDQSPRAGSRGTTVAFVHPKQAFGTLIELVEEPAPK